MLQKEKYATINWLRTIKIETELILGYGRHMPLHLLEIPVMEVENQLLAAIKMALFLLVVTQYQQIRP